MNNLTIEEYLDEKGSIIIDEILYLPLQYKNLEEVIHDKLDAGYIDYPLILAANKERYLQQIEIFMHAEKSKIKYIKTDLTYDPSENPRYYTVVFFKNDKHKINALLLAYILQTYPDFLGYSDDYGKIMNPFKYIELTLEGYGDEFKKRFFLRRYVQNLRPSILIPKFKDIDASLLPYSEKYLRKYTLVKDHDNFKEFNEIYKETEKEALKLLSSFKDDKDFKKFLKGREVKPFKFDFNKSISKNPLFKEIEIEYAVLHKKYYK